MGLNPNVNSPLGGISEQDAPTILPARKCHAWLNKFSASRIG